MAIIFVILLPAYTIILACITILRAKWYRRGHDDRGKNSDALWSRINTFFFKGTVFHIRHQPMVHSFKYPLYFSVVDLDEASGLFGRNSVHPQPEEDERNEETINPRGELWPLSSLMLLRDIDHLKSGEGLCTPFAQLHTMIAKPPTDSTKELQIISMRERIGNLVYERTNGKLDLNSTKGKDKSGDQCDTPERRKILLVTHLMYYGYCFNPVSLYFILKPNTNANNNSNEEEEEVEAIVVEVSNTPWNEMSLYVLHPDSIDTVQHYVCPPGSLDIKYTTYRYKWRKNFHVSPFMTMDHDYDWNFQVSRDRIKVEAKMIRRNDSSNESKEEKGILYFTAGFDIQRAVHPTSTYPIQLAKVICRFPIYCFIIQLWIHYEALKLLMKGVEFVPHPKGSETGASKVIAMVMRPVFAVMEVVDGWWSRWSSRGKTKSA